MNQIERLVVFAIFMENGQGIVGKAPDYIAEKWQVANLNVSDEYIIAHLDGLNQIKFRKWQRIWRKLIPLEVTE